MTPPPPFFLFRSRDVAWSIVAGLCLWAAYPPWGWWPLSLVALADLSCLDRIPRSALETSDGGHLVGIQPHVAGPPARNSPGILATLRGLDPHYRSIWRSILSASSWSVAVWCMSGIGQLPWLRRPPGSVWNWLAAISSPASRVAC